MADAPLPIHSYQRVQQGARLVNCYAEQAPINSKTPIKLLGAPGIAEYVEVGDGPVRGMARWDGMLFVVSGMSLYQVSAGGGRTLIGAVLGQGDVLMVPTRVDLVMVTSTGVTYRYDGAALSQITDPDLPDIADADFTDGYLLTITKDSDQFNASELNDSTDWDALQFASAESAPDKLVGIIVDHRQIILAGEDTVEIWWNAGTAGFPFERIPNGALEVGCSAGRSLAKADNGVFWLDDERIVRRLAGLTPQRVSTHGVEEAIGGYDTVSDAVGFVYTIEGHINYVLTFPTQGATWVFDITTGEWHERESYQRTDWRVAHHARIGGVEYVAERDSNRVGILTASANTEWGDPLVMLWTYKTIFGDGRRIKHRRFELTGRTGYVQGGDAPTVTLEKSDDGGLTWQRLPTRSFGGTGQTMARQRWFRLGSAYERTYRAFIGDDVPRCIDATQVDATQGVY